jgi:hypothetical protein
MGFATAVVDGRIYVFGGMTRHRRMEISPQAEVYDPARNSWRELRPLPVPLYQATATAMGPLIFILGGATQNGMNQNLLIYNTILDTCIRVGHVPAARRGMGAITVGRRILVIGGIVDRQRYEGSGYWFDPDSTLWREAPAMNNPSAGFGLAFAGNLWVVGGMSVGPLRRVEALVNGSWRELPRVGQLPEPRGELSAAVLEDTLLIAAGGIGQQGSSNDVFAFNTNEMGWVRIAPMRSPRVEFALVAVGNRLYAIGGNERGGNEMGELLSSVEVLTRENSIIDDGNPLLPDRVEVVIWPNPFNHTVHLALPQGFVGYQIFDLTGRSVNFTRLPIGVQRSEWSPSGLASGSYSLMIYNAEGRSSFGGAITLQK